MQRIDAHQHFWLLERGDYNWLTPELSTLYRDYLIDDLQPLLDKNRVHKTILVQAADSLNETNFMLDLADKNEVIGGVIGWIDMLGKEASSQLLQLANYPKFKGIRPMLQDIEDPTWMLNDKLTPIFQALIDNNLIFEALVKPIHLPYLNQLLVQHPGLKVVIDHGAKPNISSGQIKDWESWIQNIAENHPVYCKLSGLLTEAKQPATYADVYPYMQHLLNTFGHQRLMFGSDWPVLNLASDYTSWVNYVENFLCDLTLEQQRAVWHDNANKFYELHL